MTTNRSSRVKQIFLEAFELDEKERRAFLDEACAGDEDLRAAVDRLLAADRLAKTSDLENPILDAAAHVAGDTGRGHADADEPRVPEQIGPFRIERVIGSGGMGTVYQGVQDNPRRIVAVKVMHESLRSRSARRRFEYESSVLARLRHAAIAQVYAAGTHTEGEHSYPYFAMEYLPNALPITTYCERHDLGASERLVLFEQVCQAVHHGHQKGVIHRDIKPDNVLVDSQGTVRLIDFGVARAIDADLVADTLLTGRGQILGTLQYMSPEQVESDTSDIDTRSDVYSLGMLLYQMLTGALPYDVGKVGLAEALRVIRHQAPPRPASTSQSLLRGDLETITFKALEKDRTRRYPSAEDLRRDIESYLHLRPIAARPPSVVYQIRVFARRNRAIVGTVAALLLFLVLGSIFLAIQYLRAESARFDAVLAQQSEEDARRQAEDERRRAETERDRANDARADADRKRAEAEAISDFLTDMLESVAPYRAVGEEVTVRSVLDRVSDRVEVDFAETPDVRAALHNVLGGTYMSLGNYDKAEDHLRRNLDLQRTLHGPESADTHAARMHLGTLMRLQSRLDLAEDFLERAATGLHSAVGDEDVRTIQALNELAKLYEDVSRSSEARELFERAVVSARRALGDDHDLTLMSRNNRAGLAMRSADLERAESEFRDILEIRSRTSGDSHPETITVLNNLALTVRERGDVEEAEALLRRVSDGAARVFGEGHPNTLASYNNLASLLAATRRFDEAEQLLRDTLARLEAKLGSRNVRTINMQRNLAYLLFRLRKHDEAEALFLKAYEGQREVTGDEHEHVLSLLANIHELYIAMGQPKRAEPLFLELLESRRKLLGADDIETLAVGFHLANLYRENGELEKAQALYRPAVEAWVRARPDAPRTHAMRAMWGASLIELARYAEAEPMLLESHRRLSGLYGDDHHLVRANRANIVELYRQWGKPDEERAWSEAR